MADGAGREARWQVMSASMQGAMAFQKRLGAVHSLSHALGGLPPGLAAMGITRDTFGPAADGALKVHCHAINPRVATRDDYLMMLEASA